MSFLEIFSMSVFDHFLENFNFLSLMSTQSFNIHLFKHLLLNIINISTHRHFINLFIFSFESMSKIVNKVSSVKFLLLWFHVKRSDMIISYSSFFIIMQKYLFAKLDIYFVIVYHLSNLIIYYLLQMNGISKNIFLKHFLFFMTFFDQLLFLVNFDFKVSNSWQFKLILHISLFNIMNYNQINKME